MHRSRIGGIFIDHPAKSFEASRKFWAAAMGSDFESDGPYSSLGKFNGDVVVELQKLDDDTGPRVHLDIDTDDVDAEAARLESLGARRLRSCDGGRYWQMVDPGGLVFCVITPHTSDFDERATRWP
jgi:predicted enzyme related to lactoylglutathione lyase